MSLLPARPEDEAWSAGGVGSVVAGNVDGAGDIIRQDTSYRLDNAQRFWGLPDVIPVESGVVKFG